MPLSIYRIRIHNATFRGSHLLLALLTLAVAAAQSQNANERATQAFAFVAYPTVFDGLLAALETPVQFRALVYLNMATYNAWASFHPTAADIFGRTRFRQPPTARTVENKNTAILYALLRLYEADPQSFGGPSALPTFRKLMRDRGLDPKNRSRDTSTVIGVGNREGVDTAKLMAIDGWNSKGDLTGTADEYKLPFQDYTDYVPVNTPWRIRFPFRWQPVLETNHLGFFFRQEHVTPAAGRTIAFGLTPREVRKRRVKSPYKRRNAKAGKEVKADLGKLRRLAKKVFTASRRLTERRRLLAELFDNKVSNFRTDKNPFGVPSIGSAVRFFILGPVLDLSLDDEIIYGLSSNIATYDAMMTVWKEKRRHDAIRPTGQTMKYLFGKQKFSVAGEPYAGSVRIRAGEWQPYIRTMPHSEFPSASSCACAAFIENALINTGGRDFFPYNVTIPKGASSFAEGFPREDVTIEIKRLTKWARLCGKSRLWAGVHFEPAVPGGVRLCKGIGKSAQDVVDNLVKGKADLKWVRWLDPSITRFWEQN